MSVRLSIVIIYYPNREKGGALRISLAYNLLDLDDYN